MAKGVLPAIAIAMFMSSIFTARSDEIPTLDVRPVCQGIASQSGDPADVGLQTTFEQCVQSEQDVREQLKKVWSSFSAADKRHCVTLAKIGGNPVTPNSSHVWKWPEMCEPSGLHPSRPRYPPPPHQGRPQAELDLRPLRLRHRSLPLRQRPLRLRPRRQPGNQHLRQTSPRWQW
jgi:hypothetical protein